MAFSYKSYSESDAVRKARQRAQQNEDYNEAQAVADARMKMQTQEQNRVPDWTGGQYGAALNEALDRINNREAFSYDMNADALYQQYKDQYMTGGKMAMMDTIGQASALTGGYGNSYATNVGNQAYQGYLQKLNDVVPQLYQLAMNKYEMEGNQLKDKYNALSDRYNTEYGEYRNRVSDWNNEMNRLTNQYQNERSFDYGRFSDDRNYFTDTYRDERNWDYNLYSDAYDRAFNEYKQSVSEQQFAQQMAQAQAQFNADLGYKYDALGQNNQQFYANLGEQARQYNSDLGYKYANLGEQQRQFDATLDQNDRQWLDKMVAQYAEMAQQNEQFNKTLASNEQQAREKLALQLQELYSNNEQARAEIDLQREKLGIDEKEFYAKLNEEARQANMDYDINSARYGSAGYYTGYNNVGTETVAEYEKQADDIIASLTPEDDFMRVGITVGNRGNTNNGGYDIVDSSGNRYDSYEDYEIESLRDMYNSGMIPNEDVLNIILDKLGL